MSNPELGPTPEVLPEAEYPRFDETNLETVFQYKNKWLGVSYHFNDATEFDPLTERDNATELLSLIQLGARADYEAMHSEKKFKAAKLLKKKSPVMLLDKKLSTHSNDRTTAFESRDKTDDSVARRSAEILFELQQPRDDGKVPYTFPGFTEAVRDGIRAGVEQHREMRTRKLLEEFEGYFRELGGTEVWMRAIPKDGGTLVYAALLDGFTIHGSGSETAIEPVVIGVDGRRGLLPDSVYAEPSLHIRL